MMISTHLQNANNLNTVKKHILKHKEIKHKEILIYQQLKKKSEFNEEKILRFPAKPESFFS